MDLTVNGDFKDELKSSFHQWYARQVCFENEETVVDLKTSIIKPIHANWLVVCHEKVSGRRELIKEEFEKAGL